MKFALAFFGLCLLLAACSHRDAPVPLASDAEIKKVLPGTWVLETNIDGSNFRSVTTVAPNGDYVSQIESKTGTRRLEGTWQVKDGCVIDTTTKNSDSNVHLPYTVRMPVIRADARELLIKVGEPEHVCVFRMERK